MFIVHFLLAVISGFSVYAASSDCERLLAFKAVSELDLATLDKMSDLLALSPTERDNVRSYATFFTEALQARAHNRQLATLHSPYLVEQSRRMQDMLQNYIQRWAEYQDYVQKALDRKVTNRQNAIDAMEETLRTGKSEELVERKKQEIIGVLNRTSQRYRGEDADLDNFSHLIETISANPERELFKLKQNFGKFKEEVAAQKVTVQQNSDRALAMFKLIHAMLERRGDDIDFQTFVQLELALAVTDELGDRRFAMPPKDDPNDHSFAANYGITFDDVERDLQAWSTGKAKRLGKDVYDLVERWTDQLKKRGMVRLPVIGTISQRESLALAFLPIHPLRFQQEPTWVSDLDPGPQRGHTVMLWDISGGGELGYKAAAFGKRDPQGWIDALNSSFNNWYLMLGGNPDGQAAPLQRPDPAREALVRALLYYARYLPSEEEYPEWTSSTALAQFFFKDFANWEDPKEHLFNPNLAKFFDVEAPAFFAEIGIPRKLGEPQITDAVDQLIARILRSPDVNIRDAHLRRLFDRFPTTAFSAKMLVLKAVFGEPKPREPESGFGRLIPL